MRQVEELEVVAEEVLVAAGRLQYLVVPEAEAQQLEEVQQVAEQFGELLQY